MLSTPVEEQAQRKSTLEALQSALTITAAKTPYLENGKIDLREYDRLLERQIEGGVEGVIVGGTTGEGQVCGLPQFQSCSWPVPHGLKLMMHSPCAFFICIWSANYPHQALRAA